MNTPGDSSHRAEAGRWLHLAATPVFAAMALVTAIAGDDPARMLCQAMGHGGLSLGSMSLMYLLMAVFHAAPWCRWVALHVAGTARNIRHPGAGRGPSATIEFEFHFSQQTRMATPLPSSSPFSPGDVAFMQRALELASHARDADGEVPVGAVLALDGKVVGEGWNRNITLNDPSAHAEIGALREAGQRLGNHRFPGATLYVTLEPCAMCAMALVHARVARVVYGASDPKTGAAGSVFDTLTSDRHNHRVEVQGGLLADESATLLRAFFRAKR